MPEYAAKQNPKQCPSHPGALIADLLDDLGLPIARAARALDISRQRLTAITAEKSPVTAEMALRLGKAFGNDAEIWLQMQVAHDLWHAARRIRGAKVVRLGVPANFLSEAARTGRAKRPSRVRVAVLELADDMHRGGMLSDAEHTKITHRLGKPKRRAKGLAGRG